MKQEDRVRIRKPMRSGGLIGVVIALGLLVAATFFAGAVAAAPAEPGQQLSADARRVVDYLVDDWQKQFRSTSIPLAMHNLGIEPDDVLRLEVLEHLRANMSLANNLTYWGPNNYVFSNQEKLIAKYLIHMRERAARPASVAEATAALELEANLLRERLAFMASAGFLEESSDPLGFSLTPGYKRWAGPLQHNFHTVRIEGERPFDVW